MRFFNYQPSEVWAMTGPELIELADEAERMIETARKERSRAR